ncbi:MAG: MBOAT family protein [Bacteroidetes bacterium]|nr:MBOAT family protein [Bacteroidota bacterium]
MLFNSLEFLLFFPLVTFLFYVIPHKYRWMLLLLASCYFYMYFKPVYILILLFTIIIDYFAGIYIERAKSQKQRKLLLVLSIISNIGILVFFKYFNFLSFNLQQIFNSLSIDQRLPILDILLPIGLSFHTFQAISYTIEVYRGNQKSEKHFGIYALYVMFYPQLVAGPIERPQNVLHQFHERKYFKSDNFILGARWMLLGFLKKVVIADNVSIASDYVFNNVSNQSMLTLIVGGLFFTVQIYADFSGYSDIALGSAKVMGFDLMKNFNNPYFSVSIKDFWTRWHISLSTWFRDYVYVPLGGNRVSKLRNYLNVFIVFVLSGFWHGASWNFIVWGAMHGALVTFENMFNISSKVNGKNLVVVISKWGANFSVIILTWMAFRITDISDLIAAYKIIFNGIVHLFQWDYGISLDLSGLRDFNINQVKLLLFAVLLFFLFEVLRNHKTILQVFYNSSVLRRLSYTFAILIIFFFGYLNKVQFIYFQF